MRIRVFDRDKDLSPRPPPPNLSLRQLATFHPLKGRGSKYFSKRVLRDISSPLPFRGGAGGGVQNLCHSPLSINLYLYSLSSIF